MVQQVIDKFHEYSSIHCGSAMPAWNKQHPVSVKKLTLWELPNTSRNIMSKPAENSQRAKERGPMTDYGKTFGRKRQQPDSSSSPSSYQSHVNKGVNGHLVYVRRKHETERGKKNTSNNVDSLSSSILSRKPENEEIKEPKAQQERTRECNEISHSHEKAINGLEPIDSGITALANAPVDPERPNNLDCKADPQTSSNPDSNASVDLWRSRIQEDKTPVDPQRTSNQGLNSPVDSQRTSSQGTEAPIDLQRLGNQGLNAPVDPHRLSNQDAKAPVDTQRPNNQDPKAPVDPQSPSTPDWKERYLQLQVFLKNCDQSSQEDYKMMLRSLTAAGRSRHALELEKRALNLLLEEGKELYRMQVLNIIGEAPLQDRASPSTQTSAALSQFQRMETVHNPKSPFLRNSY